jgi:uridine kinase
MKAALIIAGYLRSFGTNVTELLKIVQNRYDVVDVYIHITQGENRQDHYMNLIDEKKAIAEIEKTLNPVALLLESNRFCHVEPSVDLNQWMKLKKLNEIRKINDSVSNDPYDIVIRTRPDLVVDDIVFPDVLEDRVYVPRDSKVDSERLDYPTKACICDAFAFGKPDIMDQYFDVLTYYPILSQIHNTTVSEVILYQHLTARNIPVNFVDIEYGFVLSKCHVFAICGDSGSGKSTLSDRLQNALTDSFTLEGDRYHKWERGDENWGMVTHLNPQANYITKMHSDVFDLKMGNRVYQVDYDHDIGKFTDHKEIQPTKNLIVCGLHTLMGCSDQIYDLKIFMDTEEQIRNLWKIRRDVTTRGHSIDKVLQSIVSRKDDAEMFIQPQIDNADIIIRFFSYDDVVMLDWDKIINLSLDVSFAGKYDINPIYDLLSSLKIPYTKISGDSKYQTIRFEKYESIQGDFYDYILLMIFHLRDHSTSCR